MSKFIRAVTLHSEFESVVDLHYLLSQKHKIFNDVLPKLHQMIHIREDKVDSSEISQINDTLQGIRN
jgi:hypothetical protein